MHGKLKRFHENVNSDIEQARSETHAKFSEDLASHADERAREHRKLSQHCERLQEHFSMLDAGHTQGFADMRTKLSEREREFENHQRESRKILNAVEERLVHHKNKHEELHAMIHERVADASSECVLFLIFL